MTEKETALALVKLLDKAKFEFSAVDAVIFTKCFKWLQDKIKKEVVVKENA